MTPDPLRIKIRKWVAGALLPEEEKAMIQQLDALSDEELEKIFREEEWNATIGMAVDENKMQHTLNHVKQHIAAETRASRNRLRTLALAASVAGFIMVAGLVTMLFTDIRFHSLTKGEKNTWTTVFTIEGERKAVYLADGTRLSLNGGSVLKVPNFQGKDSREIQLVNGELFLDVIKDDQRPLVVQAGKMRIKVLGTSFNIRHYKEEDRISVSVKSGKVALDIDGSRQQVILTKGLQAVYREQTKLISTQAVKNGSADGWLNNEWHYENTPLADVIRDLHYNYGLHFNISDTILLKKHINATFSQRKKEDIIRVLSKMADFSYSKKDSLVIIY